MTYEEFEKIYPPFKKLRDRHLKLFQVNWYIQYAEADNEISFWNFRRGGKYYGPPDPRYKGLGFSCLRDVVNLADELSISIWLYCTVPKLFPLYESFGFVCIREDVYVKKNYVRREYRRQPVREGESQCAISKSTS